VEGNSMKNGSLKGVLKKAKDILPLVVPAIAIILILLVGCYLLETARVSKVLSTLAVTSVSELNEKLSAQEKKIVQLEERIFELEHSDAFDVYSTEQLFYLSERNEDYGYIKIEDHKALKHHLWTFVDSQYNEAREAEWLTIFREAVNTNRELKDALLGYTYEDRDIYAGHIETDPDGYFTEAGLEDFLSRIRLGLSGEIYLYDAPNEPLFTRIHLRANYSSFPNQEGLFVFFPISSC
jgi:hypothetical protein